MLIKYTGNVWLQTSINGGWKLVSIGCVCFQVILAYESIELCVCSGNVLIGSAELSQQISIPQPEQVQYLSISTDEN